MRHCLVCEFRKHPQTSAVTSSGTNVLKGRAFAMTTQSPSDRLIFWALDILVGAIVLNFLGDGAKCPALSASK
jgi:hypothetical protein